MCRRLLSALLATNTDNRIAVFGQFFGQMIANKAVHASNKHVTHTFSLHELFDKRQRFIAGSGLYTLKLQVMHKIKQRYRYSVILLRELVRTDFKLRYQGSVLGYVWSLLRPLLIFIILYIVFTKFLKVGTGIPNYPVYLLLGIVLWNYFVEVTMGGVTSVVGKGDLLRKINFPKYVIILAVALSGLINLSLNAVVIAIFMIFGHVAVHWQALLMIPLILELIIASLAMAFFLSTAFVRYRDVSY